ncbi:MAG: pilin [Patescibacteria group bacterium]|nr:pilin [Patescibacteria group bacterium]
MKLFKKTNPINPDRNKFLNGANRARYFLAFLLLSVLNFRIADLVSAQTFGPGQGQTDAFLGESGFAPADEMSLGQIVAVAIQAFLGLLGIIFLVLMITAGYKWMTASGNEEKLTEAKETIWRATIGLIIVVSAYAITYFVFNSLDWFGGGGGGQSGNK